MVFPGEAEVVDRHRACSGTVQQQHHVLQVLEMCQEEMSQDKVCATALQHKESNQQNSTPMDSNNAVMSEHP